MRRVGRSVVIHANGSQARIAGGWRSELRPLRAEYLEGLRFDAKHDIVALGDEIEVRGLTSQPGGALVLELSTGESGHSIEQEVLWLPPEWAEDIDRQGRRGVCRAELGRARGRVLQLAS